MTYFKATAFVLLFLTAVLQSTAQASQITPVVLPAVEMRGAVDLGPTPPLTRVRIALQLRFHHEEELQRLLQEQADPESPLYHRFVSEQQFRAYFAATAQEYAVTLAAMRRAGFTIVGEHADDSLVDAVAPAFTVERYFRTRIDRIVRGGTGATYANVVSATIPNDLPFVESVVGLSDVRMSVSAPLRQAQGIAKTFAIVPNGPDGGFAPGVLARAYDFPVMHGFDGRGIRVADIVDGAPIASDVATFLQQFHIKQTGPGTVVIPVNGGCQSPCADTVVADMDVEWIDALAPGSATYEYELPALTFTDTIDGYDRIISDGVADVVSIPFTVCEGFVPTYAAVIAAVLAHGAATGISFVGLSNAANEVTGKGAAGPCGVDYSEVPDVPTDSAHILAAGVTFLSTDRAGNWLGESGSLLSGGGVSLVEPAPSAQLKISGIVRTGRNDPDITTPQLVNGNAPSTYALGIWLGNDFLLWDSSPIAAMVAEWAQMSGGKRLGAVDLTLYKVLAVRGYGAGQATLFHDITSGCDGPFDNVPVCAHRGYDLVTGIGSPDGYNLGRAIR